jgi:branched-chain amino acid aminotransferase
MSSGNRYAFFEGRIAPIEEAKVSIMTSALNYGTAVFEGIRAYWNESEGELLVFRLREHYERMLQNCAMLLIDLPHSADDLSDITLDLLRKEGFRTDVYIRPLGYKSGQGVGVRLHDLANDVSIFAVPFGEYLKNPKGARLMVSSWRRLDDTAIPARGKISGAYVNSALAKTEASQNGFDDAIVLCQDGHVSEASAANLFVVRKGTLITSPVTANILEGITRATVFEIAADLQIPSVERLIDRSELYIADEVFLCGTGVGLVPVIEIDHRKVASGAAGPISSRFRSLYDDIVHGREPRYRNWCTPVYAPAAIAAAATAKAALAE